MILFLNWSQKMPLEMKWVHLPVFYNCKGGANWPKTKWCQTVAENLCELLSIIKLWSFRVHFVSITYIPSIPLLILKPSSGIPDLAPFSIWDSWPGPLYSVLPRSSAVALCTCTDACLPCSSHAPIKACHANEVWSTMIPSPHTITKQMNCPD